jgi:hypothetical protein
VNLYETKNYKIVVVIVWLLNLQLKGIENVRFNLMLGKKAEDTTDNRNGVKNN